MNFASLAGLGLPRADRIAVSPGWVCKHVVIIEAGLADLTSDEDDEESVSELEVVFEADFSLDDEGDETSSPSPFERDEDDEEDDWPP